MDHFEKLQNAVAEGKIAANLAAVIHNFFLSYDEAAQENGYSLAEINPVLDHFLDLIIIQLTTPYTFEPFHQCVTAPIDYYRFGLDIIRPLVIFPKSTVHGIDHLKTMEAALEMGENVILLANHQTEPDPQAISLLLEEKHPKLAKDMIFVAGQRVITDPLAVPFSMGRNLLCIFSKRHLDTEPELKQEKLSHNQRTMKIMSQLLTEGGKCIYVAPSGGRDRRGPSGPIEVAPFDPQSLEMFWLISQHAHRKTHFHTLALATYDLLPPPSSIEKELGERRHARCTPIHLSFGKAVDMESYPGNDFPDKKQRRLNRADYIWKLVTADYARLLDESTEA